jgi:hypothetical protein
MRYHKRFSLEQTCSQTTGGTRNRRTFYKDFERNDVVNYKIDVDAKLAGRNKQLVAGYNIDGVLQGQPLDTNICPGGWDAQDESGSDTVAEATEIGGDGLVILYNGQRIVTGL